MLPLRSIAHRNRSWRAGSGGEPALTSHPSLTTILEGMVGRLILLLDLEPEALEPRIVSPIRLEILSSVPISRRPRNSRVGPRLSTRA